MKKPTKALIVVNLNFLNLFLLPFISKMIILRPNRFILKFHKLISIISFNKIELLQKANYQNSDNLDISSREKLMGILLKRNDSYEIKKFLLNFLDNENSEIFFRKALYHYLFLLDFYKSIKIFKKIYPNIKFYNLIENDISKILKIKSFFYNNLFLDYLNKVFALVYIYKTRLKYKKKIEPLNKDYILATEINNFKFFSGKIGEPNFFKIKNTLYYLTEKKNIDQYPNERFLKRGKFDFIDLRYLLPNVIFWNKFKKGIFSLKYFFSYNSQFFKIFFSQYNSYDRLHSSSQKINYHLLIESSNDLRLINLENPLAKFISNKNSCKLISYQTRSPYILDPLSYFSNFDYYFSWSSFWYNHKNTNAKKIIYGSPFKPLQNFDSKSRSIAVFPAEINDSIHCSKEYFIKFFEIILNLAKIYTDYNFHFKMKYTNQFNPTETNLNIPSNLKIYDNYSNIQKLIIKSNIVISQSFTSPGFYALGLGIKSIILSHLEISNKNLSELPIVFNYDNKIFNSFDDFISNRKQKVFLKTRKKLFHNNDLRYIVKKTLKYKE